MKKKPNADEQMLGLDPNKYTKKRLDTTKYWGKGSDASMQEGMNRAVEDMREQAQIKKMREGVQGSSDTEPTEDEQQQIKHDMVMRQMGLPTTVTIPVPGPRERELAERLGIGFKNGLPVLSVDLELEADTAIDKEESERSEREQMLHDLMTTRE
jgi:hypothetical protein